MEGLTIVHEFYSKTGAFRNAFCKRTKILILHVSTALVQLLLYNLMQYLHSCCDNFLVETASINCMHSWE